MEDWLNNPGAISRRVYESEAYQKYQRLLELDTNLFVFDKNYRDLKLAIDAFSQPERISLLFDENESQIILNHMVRFLHNYLASAKTLVDHTRLLIRDWYQGTDFYKEYVKEIEYRFADNKSSSFIEDLRNFALHYSLPVTGLQLSVRTDPETKQQIERVMFFINKSSLSKWSRWAKGKQYLNEAPEQIIIEELVDQYYSQVLDFHIWMHRRLEEFHADELNWLHEMTERVNKLLKNVGEQRTDES